MALLGNRITNLTGIINLTELNSRISGYATKASAVNNLNKNFKYCLNSVKATDHNSYLSTLLTPQPIIRSAFAIKAFNIELMSIGKSKYDARLSEIKVQFWKDQLEKIFKISKSDDEKAYLQEPISNELLHMVKSHGLSKPWFNRLIESRKKFISTEQFQTLDELEKYGDGQIASIYYILLDCLAIKNVDCDHVASHLGKL